MLNEKVPMFFTPANIRAALLAGKKLTDNVKARIAKGEQFLNRFDLNGVRHNEKREAIYKLSEAAVARFVGVDYVPKVDGYGDGGIDVVVCGSRGRMTIDAKWSTKPDGDLIFTLPDDFKADVAVQVTPLDKDWAYEWDMQLTGWITRERFNEERQIKDYGKGDRFFRPQVALDCMTELRDYLGILKPKGVAV